VEIIFWLSVLGCTYSYLLYPAMLRLLPKRRCRPVAAGAVLPTVTIIVAAHNEQTRIDAKLASTLAIDYPRDRLQIIVASDASTDGTDAIVERYRPQDVTLVRAAERKGKEHAQSLAIQAATGDIIVFTDAGTEIPVDGLHRLVRNFADPMVGALSSEDRFVSRNGSLVGEGAYVKYEMWLRRLESEHAGLVGLSGSFFAARREVCEMWDIQSPSDFNTAISCARKGLVAVTDPRVIGYYTDIKDEAKEYRRKLRTVLRGIAGMARHLEVLNPFKFGLFSFQIWSHKVMRWLVPWFMLATLLSSLLLWPVHGVYRLAVVIQMAIYLGIAAAHMVPWMRRNLLLRIGYYFVQANIAIAHATVLFLAGRRMTVWEPSKR
jgi:cellulose synthase/poly-beta-1,6-N-acetylglucosamine synthase-like glycosyltransferase